MGARNDVHLEELQRGHGAGVRGLRFYLLGDDFTMSDAPAMAKRIAPLGWHLQVKDRGNWLPEAVNFVKDNQVQLSRVPTAFFTVYMLNRGEDEASRQARQAYTAAAR